MPVTEFAHIVIFMFRFHSFFLAYTSVNFLIVVWWECGGSLPPHDGSAVLPWCSPFALPQYRKEILTFDPHQFSPYIYFNKLQDFREPVHRESIRSWICFKVFSLLQTVFKVSLDGFVPALPLHGFVNKIWGTEVVTRKHHLTRDIYNYVLMKEQIIYRLHVGTLGSKSGGDAAHSSVIWLFIEYSDWSGIKLHTAQEGRCQDKNWPKSGFHDLWWKKY